MHPFPTATCLAAGSLARLEMRERLEYTSDPPQQCDSTTSSPSCRFVKSIQRCRRRFAGRRAVEVSS